MGEGLGFCYLGVLELFVDVKVWSGRGNGFWDYFLFLFFMFCFKVISVVNGEFGLIGLFFGVLLWWLLFLNDFGLLWFLLWEGFLFLLCCLLLGVFCVFLGLWLLFWCWFGWFCGW